jgi:hypothetical protein
MFHSDAQRPAFNGPSVAFSATVKSYWYGTKVIGQGQDRGQGGIRHAVHKNLCNSVHIIDVRIQVWGMQTD